MMNKTYTLLSFFFVLFSLSGFSQPSDLPANTEPGKCYAKCLIPDEFETITEQKEIKAAYAKTLVVVPEYETVTKKIMIKPPSIQLIPVPAEYETVTEQVMVSEESKRLVVVPAEYETVTEQVISKAESKKYFTVPGEYETVTNRTLYKGGENGLSADFGDLLDPNNPNNPNNPNSIFNPKNPDSPFNPANGNNLYDANSPYNPSNPNSLLNPNNPDSPFHPSNYQVASTDNGGAAATNAANEAKIKDLLEKAGFGTLMPYLVKEGSVRLEKIPVTYETVSERIQVAPATTKWVKRQADRNCLSADPEDCLVWCLIEVPAEFKTVTRQVRKGCDTGYTFSDDSSEDGKEYCVKLVNIPPEYGARSIVTKAPTYREEAIPAEYQTITKRVVKTPATVKEEIIPAEFKTVSKVVLKSPATIRKEVIPGEYSTITRQVRKGLAGVSYLDPTGTLIWPADPSRSTVDEGSIVAGTYPTNVNPVAGYTLPSQATGGLATNGTPGSQAGGNGLNGIGFGGGDGGADNSGINTNESKIPGGLPDNYYTAGCPTGFRFDPLDNTCKKKMDVPAEYATLTKRDLSKKGGFSEWREVLCAGKVTSSKIKQIQIALKDRGYNPGPIDNVLGVQTKAALTKFQKDNKLPVGNLDFETLKALGIDY